MVVNGILSLSKSLWASGDYENVKSLPVSRVSGLATAEKP